MKNNQITINGVPSSAPFSQNGINIYVAGGLIVYSTDFGLTLSWNGVESHYEISLCDSYSKFVCGLCGNADGKIIYK